MPPLNIDPFIKDGNKISYFDFYTSTLYWDILNLEEKQVKFEFEKKIPFEIFEDPMQFYEKQENYDFFITTVIDNGKFWSSYSNHGQGANLLIADIADGKKKLFKDSWFTDILCCHEGYFYEACSSLKFLEGNFNFKAKMMSTYPIDYESNFIILRYKAKKQFLID
jgi:hypothetical protein